MQSLVLATGNAGKQRELVALLQGRGLQLLRQTELGVTSVEETGTTFEANALLKARHAAAATSLPALADDSGLEVDALGGAPGVYSARYAGEHADDAANTALLLQRLRGVELAARTARFRCVIVLVRDANDAAPLIASGCWEGHIALAAAGDGGFGYDPVFIPQGGELTISQLDEVAKNQASHRGQALQSLLARWPGSLR